MRSDVSAEMHAWVGNAEAFPILKSWNYFNHAGVSPWPKTTIDALTTFAGAFGECVYLEKDWFAVVQQVRTQFAQLLSAETSEVALMANTSSGLGTIASCIDWKPGDRIVSADAEYPSNLYPWMDVATRKGVELVLIPEVQQPDGSVRVDEQAILDEIARPNTRLLAISHGQWGSGQVMNIERLGKACRSAGVLFAVDAIQTLGVVPVDVKACCIDFLAAGSHKWLMSPLGGGVFYCRHDLVSDLHPPLIGWNSVVDGLNFEKIDLTLRDDAGRFECGSPSLPTLVGLQSSLDLILSLTPAAIQQRIVGLADQFADAIAPLGCTVHTPRVDSSLHDPVLLRGGAICFTHPHVTSLPKAVEHLRTNHKVELAARCGRLRFSPHFYNTEQQVERAVEAVAELVRSGC